MCLLPAGVLLFAQSASAQMQPHRAEYILRLGAAINAPRVGTATQDVTLDCTAWHIRRDISTEIALTSSWKLSLASKLDGDEPRDGSGFRGIGDGVVRAIAVGDGIEKRLVLAR